MSSFLIQIKTKFKQITGGISILYNEAKYVYKLDKKSLNRRNNSIMVTHYNDIKKVGVFVLVQTIPIIGWFPIFFAMIYPKQILTKHFWNEEEYNRFMKEDYEERLKYGQNLNNYLQKRKINIEKISIDSLHHEHLFHLAGANQVCSNEILLKIAPSIACQAWLKTRASEIRKDDELLYVEGINDLTLRELQIANARRGLDPTTTDINVLKSQLQSWLLLKDERVNDSILLHSSATK